MWEIISIVVSCILVPITSMLIGFITAWHKQKQYKRTIAEWANKTLGVVKALKQILNSDSIKMEPPIKKDIVNALNDLIKEERENRRNI